MAVTESVTREAGQDFIRDIIRADLASGRHTTVRTRFPPEPNGYLHIGHAKSIWVNFGIAEEFGGRCHLRFDDTNPTKEEQEFIDAIERDVRWLGFDWGEHLYHASDYFEQLYQWAEHLIRTGKAYVDDQSQDEIRAMRGTLTEPGRNSPWRDRSVEENLDLFGRMRAGEFPNGARVLRARIDMASGNINLRDPVLYRILHASHPRTGTAWCIYPSYDYAHGQSDAIEGITHSICTLEFEDHRPLYDWFIDNLPVPSRPRQYEFARLNLTHTILSKRVLTELVRQGHVTGWDDPRMPTLAGYRRRGVPPAAIREFVKRVGLAKANSLVDVAMLDFCIREVLNRTAQRRMAVLRPLKLVIENYAEGTSEELDAVNHPEDPAAGTRRIPFGRELYVERDDFMENPPKKFFRLSPGREVRLRYAYFITCREAVKNAAGEVVELRCTYDPATRGGNTPPDGRKVQATLHWVSAAHAVPAEVRLYNPLFTAPEPNPGDFAAEINPNSLEVLSDARLEPALAGTNADDPVQFERQGYFCRDPDSAPGRLVFNRTVGLRDTWAKVSGGADSRRPPPESHVLRSDPNPSTDKTRLRDAELDALLRQGESDRTERKRNASEMDRIREAVCAFANDLPDHREPGVVFVGVEDDASCSNLTVDDRLLRSLSSMRDDGTITPFPMMEVRSAVVAGCTVAVVIVHPSDNPPIRARGRIMVRVGPRRAIATPDEERRLIEKRRWANLPFDAKPVIGASLNDIDLNRFRLEYVRSLVSPDTIAQNERTTEQQLRALRLVGVDEVPTATAILMLGKLPQDRFPGAAISWRRVAGKNVTDETLDERTLTGTIADQLRRIDEVMNAAITASLTMGPDTHSRTADYPLPALQQLVRNAVMHRNYDGANAPVRVTWFSDRVEILNPGGPFGAVTPQTFGKPGFTDYRNPTLAEALKGYGFVERFGQGLEIVRRELAENGNPPADFQFPPLDAPTWVHVIVRKRT